MYFVLEEVYDWKHTISIQTVKVTKKKFIISVVLYTQFHLWK